MRRCALEADYPLKSAHRVKGPRIFASRLASIISSTLVLGGLIGGALADAQSEPPDTASHLLVVPDTAEGVAALARTDARVVATYESFALVEAAGADDERLRRAGADRRDDMRTVRTAAGAMDPKSARSSLAGKDAPERDEVLALVQFIGPPKDAWLERLRETSVRIVTYQPENSYVVHASGDEVDRLAALVGSYAPVRAVGVLTARDKLEAPSSPTGWYAVQTVSGSEGESARQDASDAGTEVSRAVSAGTLHTQYLQLTADEAAELARDPAVVAIEPYAEPGLADERAAQIVAGNLSGFAPSSPDYLDWLVDPARFPSETTFDFAIDVTDEGLDGGVSPPAHSDFRIQGSGASRVAYLRNYSSDSGVDAAKDCGGHGTNVASIAAGYNSAGGLTAEEASGFNYGLGVAPFALVGASKIFTCAGAFAGGWTPGTLASNAYGDSARISNNSWGTKGLTSWGDYSTRAQQYDAVVRDARTSVAGNQEMVEVFAAGNDGEGNPDTGGLPNPNEGYGTIMAEATAKNVITVGAAEGVRASGTDGCLVPDTGADSARDIIDFSSRGPTDDGRLKPDIVAPGTHVSGARPRHPGYTGSGTCNPTFGSGFYSLVSGSSQAAPQVAGAAALVRHWFKLTEPPFAEPSPAMTKAFLLNTASDLAGGDNGKGATIAPGPNTDQGWGRVNLGSAFDSTAREYRDQLSADTFTASGQSVLRTYKALNSGKPVKVTLAWTDAPGPVTGGAWVNNLDLEVEAGGRRYLGNVFAGAFSHTGGSADTRNNVESVYLPAGVADRFAVTVKGLQITGDGVPGDAGADATDQDFALVVSNADDQPAPVLVHSATTVNDPGPGGDGDSTFESDEEIVLTEQVRNAGTVGATGLAATLSGGGGLAVTQPSAAYPDLAVGATGSNAPGFEAELPNVATCGVDAPATLDITTTTPAVETHRIALSLPTGESSSPLSHNAAGLPLAVPDDSATGVSSTVFVAERGRIKDLDVRLPGTVAVPGIEHDFLGDVVIDLIGPDGTSVRLAEHPGGPDNFGKDFVNVTFDDEAALRLGAPDDAVTAQRPPYNGTFKPQNDQLSRFDGKSRRGTWTLRVRDLFEGDTGTLRAWGVTSRKAVCDFDSTPPDTTLVATPGNPTNETAPTFGFTSPDAGATFECSLDAAAYDPCTSPKSYSGVAGGSHTFRVRAIDGSGNEDPTPDAYTWTIDLTPPDTSIVSGPAQGSTTSSTSANFGFSSEAQAHFECRLDLTSFTDCSDPQPQSYAGLADGGHTFQVRAIDLAHNTDPTPASRTWTVDTTAPSPTVTAPIGPTEDSEPTFTGTAGSAPGDAGSVTVRVYSGASLLHTLPATVSGGVWSVESPTLALGGYTVEVQQSDSVGNSRTSSPTAFSVVTDAVAPIVTVTSPVSGSSTADTTPSFAGAGGTAPGDDGTVTVKIWNGVLAAGLPAQTLIVPRDSASGAWAAEATQLAEGTYTVRAEQGDSALPTENVGQSTAVAFTVSLAEPPPPQPPALAPSFAVAQAEMRLSDALAGRYIVLAACASACEVSATLKVSARAARRLGLTARSLAIGGGTKRLPRAGTAAVKLRLSQSARAALRVHASATATLGVRVVDGTHTLVLKRKITLRQTAGLGRTVRRGMGLWAMCSEACPLTVGMSLSASAARKLGLKPGKAARMQIASGRLSGGPSAKRLTVKVKRSAKKALLRARSVTPLLEAVAGTPPDPQRRARRSLKLSR